MSLLSRLVGFLSIVFEHCAIHDESVVNRNSLCTYFVIHVGFTKIAVFVNPT